MTGGQVHWEGIRFLMNVIQREMSDVQRISRDGLGRESDGVVGHFRVKRAIFQAAVDSSRSRPLPLHSEAWQSKNQAAFLVMLAIRKVFFQTQHNLTRITMLFNAVRLS